MASILDNPVWEALCSHQHFFNIGDDRLKYFPADVSPFVAMQHWNDADMQWLVEKLPADRTFSVMMVHPVQFPDCFEIVFACPLYQMVCQGNQAMYNAQIPFRQLDSGDVKEMLDLTARTRPGPFLARTCEMGNYFGIFEKGSLVAMAGERLRLPGYTEISAICTDPAYLGKGYATYLSHHVAASIFADGSIPFLHVKTDNVRAIQVYQRLGFRVRSEVFFAIFRKK